MAGFLNELFRFGFYKRNQGRVARQATFGALAVIVTMGAWSLSRYLGGVVSDYPDWPVLKQNVIHYAIPVVLLIVGLWASFRAVQMPAFADFLISVEGEMNKVSWPSRAELFRASLVVILVIFMMAFILFAYDLVLTKLLEIIDAVISSVFG